MTHTHAVFSGVTHRVVKDSEAGACGRGEMRARLTELRITAQTEADRGRGRHMLRFLFVSSLIKILAPRLFFAL